jgi:YjjG family noncanonical pyrimidine nucleotidase
MKYRNLLLDLDDTLFDYHRGQDLALDDTRRQFEIRVNPEQFRETYDLVNEEIWLRLERREISAERLRVERFQLLFEQLGISADAAEFSAAYLDRLAQAHFLMPGAMEFLEYCRDRSKMVLITNGLSEVQYRRISMAGLEHFFAAVIVSEEVGFPKPHPGIFAAALEAGGIAEKSSVLMVGDNLLSDIRGGNEFGIDTCWLNWNDMHNETNIVPTLEVKSLVELREWLNEKAF